ncbi:MAG: histidine kinase [Clostridiales bacterium]|nr:histidine kinase [Clostridiales bacterium]
MQRKYFGSLRRQFGLLTISSVLVIMVMTTMFLTQASGLMQKKNVSFVHTLLEQLTETLNQVGNEMIYLSNAVYSNETLQQYYHAQSPVQRMAHGETFIDFSSSLLEHNRIASHILVVNSNYSVLSATEHNIAALDRLDERYNLLNVNSHASGFFGPVHSANTGTALFAYVRPIYNTSPGAHFKEKLGTCIIFSRMDVLNATLNTSLATPSSVLMLVDEDNHIISSTNNDNEFISALPASVFSLPDIDSSEHHTILLDGNSCLVDSLDVASLGWRLISIVPEYEISVDFMPLLGLGLLICIICALITALWSTHIHHSITEPLGRITAFIENDLDDKLQNRIHINTNSEMELFCQEINTLLDKVTEVTAANIRHQTHAYELSLAKKRAEFSALQSQINPHFLYNTLDCLRGYGYMLHSEEIVSITNSLSAIMRYCIKGSDTVALRDEMNIIHRYLDIIRIRFPNRFAFHIDIADDLLGVSIPRVILQPVVENAIYHGLESLMEGGRLIISCHRTEQGDCQLCVMDNGGGIAPDTLREIHEKLNDQSISNVLNITAGDSLGLVNIHNRLRNHYGDRYGLKVECPEEGGTCVTLTFPYYLQPTPAHPQL